MKGFIQGLITAKTKFISNESILRRHLSAHKKKKKENETKKMKHHNDIIIAPSDKRRSVVIMDSTQYINKKN